MTKKPNGYYQVLVLGTLLRLHQLGYQNPQIREVYAMLTNLGLVQRDDQNAYAAVGMAFNSKAARELRRDFEEGTAVKKKTVAGSLSVAPHWSVALRSCFRLVSLSRTDTTADF